MLDIHEQEFLEWLSGTAWHFPCHVMRDDGHLQELAVPDQKGHSCDLVLKEVKKQILQPRGNERAHRSPFLKGMCPKNHFQCLFYNYNYCLQHYGEVRL